jgi:hypothetical protein
MLVGVAVGVFVEVTTDAAAVGDDSEDVFLVVQPVVALKTSAPINNKGNAFFNGMLMYRFIIHRLDSLCNSCQDTYARGEGWLNNSYPFFSKINAVPRKNHKAGSIPKRARQIKIPTPAIIINKALTLSAFSNVLSPPTMARIEKTNAPILRA